MKKSKYVLLLLIIFILIAIGIYITNNRNSIKENNQVTNSKDSAKVHNAIKDTIPSQDFKVQDSVNKSESNKVTIPSNWKTYTNNQYGFTLQYPSTWSKYGKDANVIDRSGTIIAIKINFIDTVSNTTLLIKYHLAPKGAELYNNVVSQFDSAQGLYSNGVKQIDVAGQKAIKAISTVSIDGKEHVLNPPEKLILVDLLDKQQTGEIQLQFRTPLTDDKIELDKFERLLSTFKFIN